MNCGLDTSANALMKTLTEDVDIKIPDVDLSSDLYNFPGDLTSDLYKEVSSVSNEDITRHSKEGEGTFDALMSGLAAHLDTQYRMGRITGDDYSRAYIALTEAAMANAVQFVLQRDTNKWAAINAQLGAITARVMLETEKTKLATIHIDALAAKTRHALGKTQLAISGVEHCAAKFRYENILPKENTELQKRIEGVELDNRGKSYNLANILPTQHAGMELENDTRTYNLEQMLPAQLNLLSEQAEVQRAQTLDTRSDAVSVSGTLGKQKELYDQQIESYQRNAETSAAKMFLDSWITQKSLDEDLIAPDALTNASIQEVMNAIKTLNGLTD